MSELAFNVNGEAFEVPATAAGWKVKRMKAKGAPGVVYGRDGLPLVLSVDAGIDELRAEVDQPGRTLAPKTINNCLTILRRMLVIAYKRGLLDKVPEVEWLKTSKPDFDFFDFDEAERLVAAADGEWRTMILVALRTGMRQGELLAPRWEDVDLVAGRITVKQNVVWGHIGTPKSGKGREIALGEEVLDALKKHRHLRGPLVFCRMDGVMMNSGEIKWPPRLLARSPAHVRESSRQARRAAQSSARAARARDDHDDDAPRASRA
jgi:integrase